MFKTYILTFDPHKSNAVALHAVIRDNRLMFTDWWHFLASTYILVSRSSLDDIKTEIQSKWPNQQYLIFEIHPKHGNYEGWLPAEAWAWIRKYYGF